MKKTRVLIVGGSSYVGLGLAFYLSPDFEVTATYCNNLINTKSFRTVKIDLLSSQLSRELRALGPFDQVVWCAQSSHYSQLIENYGSILDVNIFGLQRILDFCRLSNVKHFIYLSSGTIYKNPGSVRSLSEDAEKDLDSYYAFSKYTAEQICTHYALATDMKVTILRLFTVYGPNQKDKILPRLWKLIHENREIYLNQNIGMFFNAIYIEDLTKIIFLLLNKELQKKINLYNIANPEVLRLDKVCQLIGKLENKNAIISAIDKPITYSIADIFGLTNALGEVEFTSIHTGLEKIAREKFLK